MVWNLIIPCRLSFPLGLNSISASSWGDVCDRQGIRQPLPAVSPPPSQSTAVLRSAPLPTSWHVPKWSAFNHVSSLFPRGEKLQPALALGSPCFYLDTDFTRLWGCHLHLLERERFAHCPGNSSSAPDDLQGEGGRLLGSFALGLGWGEGQRASLLFQTWPCGVRGAGGGAGWR